MNPLAKVVMIGKDGKAIKGNKVGVDAVKATWKQSEMNMKLVSDEGSSNKRLWVLQVIKKSEPYYIGDTQISPVAYFTIAMWSQKKENGTWSSINYLYGLWETEEHIKKFLTYDPIEDTVIVKRGEEEISVVLPKDKLDWTWVKGTRKAGSLNYSIYFKSQRAEREKKLLVGFYYSGTGVNKGGFTFPIFKSTKGTLLASSYFVKDMVTADPRKEVVFMKQEDDAEDDTHEIREEEKQHCPGPIPDVDRQEPYWGGEFISGVAHGKVDLTLDDEVSEISNPVKKVKFDETSLKKQKSMV